MNGFIHHSACDIQHFFSVLQNDANGAGPVPFSWATDPATKSEAPSSLKSDVWSECPTGSELVRCTAGS